MKIELSKGFSKRLAGRIEQYEFEVGILEDKEYKLPLETPEGQPPQLKTYAGGPARKQTREGSGQMISDVLLGNMKRLNINILQRPFQETSSAILKFTEAFLKMAVSGTVSEKRVVNLIQAIVRNPILRQEYGKNKSATADAKGFDRHLIDTGQTFQNIKARVKRVRK